MSLLSYPRQIEIVHDIATLYRVNTSDPTSDDTPCLWKKNKFDAAVPETMGLVYTSQLQALFVGSQPPIGLSGHVLRPFSPSQYYLPVELLPPTMPRAAPDTNGAFLRTSPFHEWPLVRIGHSIAGRPSGVHSSGRRRAL